MNMFDDEDGGEDGVSPRENETEEKSSQSSLPPMVRELGFSQYNQTNFNYKSVNVDASWTKQSVDETNISMFPRAQIEQNPLRNGSDRKRNRRAVLYDENALDDIMGQITSKLTVLSTGEEANQQHSIDAFIEVLNCTKNEAAFYLESSAWDIQTAVMLWLENNPSQSWSRSGTVAQSIFQPTRKYQERLVTIDGLDSDWSAFVDPFDGSIYFLHVPTGVRQKSVPGGFADLPGPEESSEQMAVNDDRILTEENEDHKNDNGKDVGEGWVPSFQSHIFGTHSEYWRGDGASEVDTEGRIQAVRLSRDEELLGEQEEEEEEL